jgi:nitrate reductase gamma subunit
MSGSIGLAVSYSCLLVCIVAVVLRSIRIARLPLHLRWELAPVPREQSRGRYGGSYLEEFEWWRKPREESTVAELAYILKEIVFLKALREHNRMLWWFSYPFHLGLYALALAAGLICLSAVCTALGVPRPGWGVMQTVVPWLAGGAYAMGAVGALGLLGSRTLDRKLRTMTTPVALFNLVLLLAVFVTGLSALLTVEGFIQHTVAYASALLTARPVPAMPGLLAAHVAVSLFFLAYLPFSQMMHPVAKYFTYHQVRWDDRSMEVGSSMEREVQALLQQPVTWAAPHVGADGTKSWVDVASGNAST